MAQHYSSSLVRSIFSVKSQSDVQLNLFNSYFLNRITPTRVWGVLLAALSGNKLCDDNELVSIPAYLLRTCVYISPTGRQSCRGCDSIQAEVLQVS